MKRIFALLFAMTLALTGILQAQVEILPPDFTLFGKMNGDYCAEYIVFTSLHTTNEDYLFPDASPFADERVYFLHRPPYYSPTLGIQTYVVPDDVYVYLPIIVKNWDNVDTLTPFTPEELRDLLRADINNISGVRLNIDGVPLANPPAYRTESPFFSMYFAVADNLYSFLLERSFVGLDDPVVSGGYLAMLKPLPPGFHDVHTAYTYGEPNGFTRERHYEVISLPVPQFLAHETEKLAASVADSLVAPNRRQPLLGSLHRAEASFSSNNLRAGINHLRAFEHVVRGQVARKDKLVADRLTAAAQKIIDKASARLPQTDPSRAKRLQESVSSE